MALGPILVRLTIEERAEIDRARGDVSVGLWAKRRLLECARGVSVQVAPPVRQELPSTPAPAAAASPVKPAPTSAERRLERPNRAAAIAAISNVQRRPVSIQRDPDGPTYDTEDAQA